jgi:hypothetical protein
MLKNLEPKEIIDEDGYFRGSGWSYPDLIDSMEIQILFQKDFGSYQGDTLAIVKKYQFFYGLLEFGWGSCSGCDALKACNCSRNDGKPDIPAVTKLRDDLYNSIQWKNKADLIDYLKNRDWAGTFWGCDNIMEEFVEPAIKALEDDV